MPRRRAANNIIIDESPTDGEQTSSTTTTESDSGSASTTGTLSTSSNSESAQSKTSHSKSRNKSRRDRKRKLEIDERIERKLNAKLQAKRRRTESFKYPSNRDQYEYNELVLTDLKAAKRSASRSNINTK